MMNSPGACPLQRTAMAKINDPVASRLYLQIACAVTAAGCEKDNRSVSVLGCIRYAILRTKLAVVEVVRGHCAVIQKECGWLCKRKH